VGDTAFHIPAAAAAAAAAHGTRVSCSAIVDIPSRRTVVARDYCVAALFIYYRYRRSYR